MKNKVNSAKLAQFKLTRLVFCLWLACSICFNVLDCYLPASEIRGIGAHGSVQNANFYVYADTDSGVFSDISGHWAQKCIEWMNTQKIFAGYPDGTFRPQELMKRGEFAAAFCNLLKKEPSNPSWYADVPEEHWASRYVGTLQTEGILREVPDPSTGYNIEGYITRMEIARMFVHTSPKATEATQNSAVYYPLYDYKDYHKLSEVDQRYVGILYEAGIIRGYPEDMTFKMYQPATRAEIATLMEKFIAYRSKVDEPVIKEREMAKVGFFGDSHYVDRLQFPQYLKRYSWGRDVRNEETLVTYRIDNIAFLNYDTYNEDTPGYRAEYKDLMDRYQAIWRTAKENKLDWNGNFIKPEELCDLPGKDIIVVEYEMQNHSPYLLDFQINKVAPWLMNQKDAEMYPLGKMNQAFLFDNYQLAKWEKGERDRFDWTDEKSFHVIAFYLADNLNVGGYSRVKDEYKAQVQYISLHNGDTSLYNSELRERINVGAQSIIFKLEE